MSEFLAMGGYAAYVWPAWGISVLALAGLVAAALLERRAVERRLKQLEEPGL
ncbi:heme exporter protein CcmD [Maricaulis sp. CAU 1757]